MPCIRRATPFVALALALVLPLLGCATAMAQAPMSINEASLVTMMDDVIKYYDETKSAEGQILALLPAYEKNKDSAEYRKLRFLFDTHQKITASLNNLIDVLYISIKLGNYRDKELNEYIYNRSKNIITFLNHMVYFLTTKNQEIELDEASDVQKLYNTYLVRLTTLLYDLNRSLSRFHT